MIYKFKLADGSPARDFSSVEEMDEVMIQRWNEVVRPCDKIYNLGDVCFKIEVLDSVMPRLLGHKRLIRGNHDTFQTNKYLQYFDEVYASRVLDRILFTHIPVHPESMRGFKGNVHGHTHQAAAYPPVCQIKKESQQVRWVPYLNLCVEKTSYRPVDLETLKKMIRKEAGDGGKG
jgi:calcineurin-like phosphoesterase family protein